MFLFKSFNVVIHFCPSEEPLTRMLRLLFVAVLWLTLEPSAAFMSLRPFSRQISTAVRDAASARMMATKQKKIAVPDDFVSPEPKPLSVADGDYASALTGTQALAWRLGTGVFVVGWQPASSQTLPGQWPGTLNLLRDGSSLLSQCKRPEKPIVIYEYEASPFCRKVREACSMLDLTVEYRPCPGARQGWSDTMAQSNPAKRRTVPYMEDYNEKQAVKMFESDDIIEYLFDTCKLASILS